MSCPSRSPPIVTRITTRALLKVHSGGKRIHHEFRALYDYYGKRVDYGEGEFPSCWPADIAQARADARVAAVDPQTEIPMSSLRNDVLVIFSRLGRGLNQFEPYLHAATR